MLVMATSALAETPEFQAAGNNQFPAKVKITSITNHTFKFGKADVKCGAASFSGELKSSSPTLKLVPTFEKCVGELSGKTAVTVKAGTCSYELGSLSSLNEEEFEGTMSIAPSGCGFVLTPSSPEGCSIEIPAQKSLSQIKFDDLIDEGAGQTKQVKIEKPEWVSQVKGMEAHSKGCLGLVPEKTKEATYNGSDQAENVVAAKAPGLEFVRENYSWAVFAGVGNSNNVWEFGGATGTIVTCVPGTNNTNMSFAGDLFWRRSYLEVTPGYSAGCTEGANASTVSVSRCKYVFTIFDHVMNNEYTGIGEILNIGGNCVITIIPKAGCTIKVETQTPSTSTTVMLSLSGGSPKQVEFKPEWEGVTYNAEGTCTGGLSGRLTNGKYKGTLKLKEIEIE